MTNTAFRDSQEAAFRKMVRDAIRKGPFTRAERDVTLAMVNHWFHHKSGQKPFIHPNRATIARKARVTEKTVSRAFGALRAASVLRAVSGTKGGQSVATKYHVNIWALMTLCGCGWLDDFMRGRSANVPVNDTVLSRYNVDRMSRCLMMSEPHANGCDDA